ncbi:dihydrofolate reductase [Dechloromonas sp.]|uniref:dihydrofolate reductase n=1 Tax=Dechloromonas sp. TaxID=1917218 RepID=UPI0021705498|nr:dihydrofolate reductase [Dechloromonas sp.]MBU3695888.1 dihydrofolate reductase [Dechloromonas sp.]
MIAAIGAVASNDMLGLDNWLPWDIPEELAYFERTVAGAALVVGRLTYESMDIVPVDTFVVTGQENYVLRSGCHRVASVEAGLRQALATGKPVFVIGGASVYAAAWPYCERFFLTRIDKPFDGDTRFPDSIPLDRWAVVADSQASYLERRSGEPVICRFLQYAQPDVKSLNAA